jgi:aminoglycoside phosphotransferase (APT) family kinase protein
VADTPGIDPDAVDAWLGANVADAAPPFRYDLVAAGGSNLTYRITDRDGTTWALRRPPTAHVLASAHDMGREWRIIAALDGTAVLLNEEQGGVGFGTEWEFRVPRE